MTIDSELMERLAAIEHERWAAWQKYMHNQCIRNAETGVWMIPQVLFEHWERQIATPYADLTEREKESDREQVRRYLPALPDFAYAQAIIDKAREGLG